MSTQIVVPQLGESVVEARIARWLKKEGDAVTAGEPVVELETEKIDLEVGSEQAGVLAKIAHQEGEDVKVGDVLAIIEPGATTNGKPAAEAPPAAALTPESTPESAPASASASASASTSGAAAPAAAATPAGAIAEAATSEAGKTDASKERATPTARRMAETHEISLASVPGSGEAGRITKRDVAGQLAPAGSATAAPVPAVAKPAPAPVAPAAARPAGTRTEERVRMSKRRLTIARNLVEAQRTAAMLTTFNEVDMSAMMALRERRKQAFKEKFGVGLGIASFFVKASVVALKAFPRLNAEVQGEEMVLKHYYDVGIAVGAPQGLVVPVLRDADAMTFAQIEQGIRQFAAKAEGGSLTLEDLRGGTFTITNGGVFGSLMSTPILNPPQVGILGLHKIEERPMAIGGQVVVRPMMYTALSYDHRIVDGLEAVQFLVRVKELIEDPGQMLLEG